MSTLPTTFPRVPLKQMDPSMLVFELDRETHRLMPEAAELITSAATMASFLHREQTRSVRGDMPRVPYIEHPLRVALRLIRWGVRSPGLIAAALLHDVLEDCSEELLKVFGRHGESGLECLMRLYGPVVANDVNVLTNPIDGTRYHVHIRHLVRLEHEALLIKTSDLKDNAGSIRHQMGYGNDERMLRRARKYLPAIEDVVAGLKDICANLKSVEGQLHIGPYTAVAPEIYDRARADLEDVRTRLIVVLDKQDPTR